MTDESDDDDLLAIIRQALDAVDPMPPAVLEMAAAVPSLARFDADVVEFLRSETSLVAVRDGDDGAPEAATGPLVLTAASSTVVVDLSVEPLTVDVVGDGADGTGTGIEFHHGDGRIVDSRRSDGLYRPTEPIAGPVRIVVRHAGEPTAVSEWFTVVRATSEP